jgi:phosphohistidine swiveling domain-containing protein
MIRDFQTLDRPAFMRRYGHIRPGTFDITVPRYDQEPSLYFGTVEPAPPTCAERPGVEPGPAEIRAIDELFAGLGYGFDWAAFRGFAADAISARERVKFLYSRNVSDALEIIRNVGALHGYDREIMSFLTISDIETFLDLDPDLHNRIAEVASSNKVIWARNQPVRLPELLLDLDDVCAFEVRASTPNFITDKTVEAEVAGVTGGDLSGRLVFIESADPGFDWIFTRSIAGFVTKFGGENSHMAIRAREFGLPAVIGAGSAYDRWRASRLIRIECGSRRVEAIL